MTKYDYYVDIPYKCCKYHAMYDILVKYDKYVMSSGYDLLSGIYNVRFECTAKEWKPIAAALRRRGKVKVTRYNLEDGI